MKPYPTYKDSGIEWIGEIPEHWGNYKISRSFKLIGSGTTPKADNEKFYNNGDINWILTGDLKDNIINESTKKITQEALDKHSTLKIYPKNTLLIAMYGATIGKVGILNIEACTNQACCALSQSDFFNIKFLYYWFITNRNQIINLSYGGGQPNISQEIIKSLKISGPSLKEQNNIVSYLDDRVSQIDETIAKKEKLIELLEEERKAVINEAVTKGLNPNVKLKPSGIEWLGDIPVHWKISRLKYLSEIKTGEKDTVNREDDGEYPFFVRSQSVERINSYSFDGEAVLTAGDGVGVAKVFHYINGKFDYHQRVYKISHFKKITGKYFYFYLKENLIREVIKHNAKSTVDSLRLPMFQNFPVVFGDIREQEEIVDFLEEQNNRIDNILIKIKKEIELLIEYRQALIFEAVTGKIDVRDFN